MKTIEEQVAFALREWEREIARAETGYDGNVYDWTSALSSRDFLHGQRSDSTYKSRDRLDRDLERLDRRFTAATREDLEGVLSAHMTVGPEWYWSRVPLMLSPDTTGAWTLPR